MIEILVPNFYDSTNNIFSKNIIKKIVICKNNIFTKINTSINENENIWVESVIVTITFLQLFSILFLKYRKMDILFMSKT